MGVFVRLDLNLRLYYDYLDMIKIRRRKLCLNWFSIGIEKIEN